MITEVGPRYLVLPIAAHPVLLVGSVLELTLRIGGVDTLGYKTVELLVDAVK
jgi:hypothetical protein